MKILKQFLLSAILISFYSYTNAQTFDEHVIRHTEVSLSTFQNTESSGIGDAPSVIEIPLFDGQVVQIQQTKVVERSENDISWFGTILGVENGSAILVVKNGNITGRLDLNGVVYRISPVEGDIHSVYEQDIDLLQTFENDIHESEHSHPNQPSAFQQSVGQTPLNDGNTAAPGDPQVFDVLAVFSIEAQEQYPDLEARIQLAIDYTNQTYENSLIDHRVNLVAIAPLNVRESGQAFELSHINNFFDGRLDFVHDLRLQHRADVISIWVTDIEDYCGLASDIYTRPDNASFISRVSCGGPTFAHELGHIQGARHNIEQDSSTVPFAYAHGSGSPTNAWRSIMSYVSACDEGPCTRIPYFSSPLLTFDGESLGDETLRDNARVIDETSEEIASFSNHLYPNRASSISVEDENGVHIVDLWEQFPGVWVGETIMDQGLENVFLNMDGERLGEAFDQSASGINFSGTLAVGSTQPVQLQPWQNDLPVIFKFVERYRYLKVDHGLFAEESMFLRGTPNDFAADTPMVHYGFNLWVGELTFTGEPNDRFKFDVHGDWQENYGVGETDGTIIPFGGDIHVDEPGTYRIYLQLGSNLYWLVRQPEENEAPVAEAGNDIYVVAGEPFNFDGSGSTDSDGTIVNYEWSVGVSGVNAQYTFDDLGVHTVFLTVTDDDGATGRDHVFVHVSEEVDTWRRTMVLIYGETNPGQDMFIRGGIDHNYANTVLNRGCTSDNYRCAIPIRYLNGRNQTTAAWKTGDRHLDWYGVEAGQNGGSGSALDWTTNQWDYTWGPRKTYDYDGFGEFGLNRWGHHYWIFEVDMDCSATVNGWFELKSFISNGPGWEGNISQPGAPYTSRNHFAECGKFNVFRRNTSAPVTIEDL